MSLRIDLAEKIHAGLKVFGIRVSLARPLRDSLVLTRLKSEELGVRTILDIGANTGQFAKGVRKAGWARQIVSFEPTSEAYKRLSEHARKDPLWTAAPQMAIGSIEGEVEINISVNSVSSSIFQVDHRSTDVEPDSGFRAVEKVAVRDLDSVMLPEWQAPFTMKIDTQGFELEVLRGARATLENTAVVSIEMSLSKLYEGGASLVDVYSFLEQAGFRCISLTEVFCDFARNEVLQVDGTFVRDTVA